MKYVPGPMVGQLSGSQGNTTASHNRNGSYLRNRTIPVNPNTARQTVIRNDFQEISELWKTATENERSAWRTLGEQMERLDSQGQIYNLSGLQAFQSVNMNRKNQGLATTLVAPAMPTVDVLTTLVPNVVVAVGVLTFTVAFTPTPLGAADKLQIWATAGVSAGRRFFGKGDFKLITTTAAAATSPQDISAAYAAIYGNPVVNQKVAVRANVVTEEGFIGAHLQAFDIVTAI